MDMLADPQPLADGLAALRAWLAREFSSPSIIVQTAAIAAAGGLAMLVAPSRKITNCQPGKIDVSQSSNDVDASAVAKHTKEPTQRLSAPIPSAQVW